MLTIDRAKNVPVTSVKPGDWLVFTKPHLNMHIVEVEKDGETVTLRCNYGEGYPGVTKFYMSNEWVYIN